MSNRELTAAEIYALIDQEILWCVEHPDKNFTSDYRKGFSNGLIQAKYLIQQARGTVRGEG